MGKEEKLRRWKAKLRKLGINSRQAAEKLKIHRQTAYSWNCGQATIPDGRMTQIETMR